MKRFLSILWLFMLLLVFSLQTFALDSVTECVGTHLYETVKSPIVGTIGGEWAILGLARSGLDIPDEYFENYYQAVVKHIKSRDGNLHNKKYTEYSRVIIALTAIGKNPKDVAGYNLLTPLGDYEKTVFQGINGAIWALIALDCGNYDMPENAEASVPATREMYINYILENQTADGMWTLSGSTADADVTAMALQALSKYQDNAKVKSAIEKALVRLSELQNENGGFSAYESENSESSVQVLVALCELGIAVDDAQFVKNGKSVLDNLLTFYDGKSAFKHNRKDSAANQMATEQCFYALVAAERAQKNETSLYNMSDVLPLDTTEKNLAIQKLSVIYPNNTFADIAAHKAKSIIESLASRGIINGKSKNCFEPNSTMSRAEFATIITRALALPERNNAFFVDVKSNDWFYRYVNTAYAYGIVNGVSDDRFNPNGTITREESAVMVTRATKLCGMAAEMDAQAIRDVLAQFFDYVKASDWSRSALAFCYSEGILDSSVMDIKPKEAVTRAEIASMLYNMLCMAKLI